MCPHTHTTTHLHTQCISCSRSRTYPTLWSTFRRHFILRFLSLCVSLRPEERRGRCLLLAWQCRVGVGRGGEEGGAERWVGVDWVCSATAHGTADNITGLTLSPACAHTHTHTHACSWRAASFLALNLIRAYVYGSEHMWPPLFPHTLLSARLSSPSFLPVYQCFTPSVSRLPASLSVWLPVFFDTFHLSCHIHRCVSTFINWQTVQLCPGGVRSRSTAGKPHCKPPS